MSNDDFSHLLNNFSISTNEEKLTQQLDRTHLDSNKTPSIFTVQRPTTSNQQQWLPSSTSNEQGWNPDTTVNTNKEQQDEGWGDEAPAYTSISQGTYFGFNSIMQPEIFNGTTENSSTQNTAAFSKYKDKPVSFTSALNDKQQKK